ncbi:hypothetical protein [Salimicrobium halophilum]|uniref:PrcB C-terminal n=1 Tax=Salimicrobium halophilum TaxID=86666 RepID=A0A1G8R6K7_9BACI|nr:hypothetical protein [Salimicrobium halophilum]SDJ12612.1 hypothetical protein SAMN04490247_0861 [Salimicrobium halophilum]
MKNRVLILVVFLLLAGCGNSTTKGIDSGDEMDYEVLASAKTLPEDFEETAFHREDSPHFLMRQAGNEAELEKWWKTYRLKKEAPSVDFSENTVFFLGLYESGTCPVEIGDIKANADKDMMTVTTSVSDGACTTDQTPRTIIYAVDRSVAENIEVIEMNTGGSTFLPL